MGFLRSHVMQQKGVTDPQTAFPISGVLEQVEAHICFHPEPLTMAAPSSDRSLLNPLLRIHLLH